MAEFKVGGKVICVKNNKDGLFKRNEVYPVEAIRWCKCGNLIIDIGIYNSRFTILRCTLCGYKEDHNGTCWFGHAYFLPLDDFKEVTFEQIKEKVPVSAQ